MNPKVYFTREITPEKVLALFNLVEKELPGKVAVKVHSGEKGNQNFLRPEFWKPVIDHVDGTVVECNTAYEGERNTTEKHKKLFDYHGWTEYYKVDLLDAEGPDLELNIPNALSPKFVHQILYLISFVTNSKRLTPASHCAAMICGDIT